MGKQVGAGMGKSLSWKVWAVAFLGLACCLSVRAQAIDVFLPPPLPAPPTRSAVAPPSQAMANQQRELEARRRLSAKPDDEEAILALADSLVLRKQKKEAIHFLELQLARYPYLAEVSLTLAKVNLQANQTNIAASRISQAERANPQLPDLHFWWANYHMRCEEPLTAYRVLQTPHPYSSENMHSQGLLVRGIALSQLGLPGDAAGQFSSLTSHSEPELSKEAANLLAELEEARAEERFQAEGTAIMRLDTNPSQVPTRNVIGGVQPAVESWVGQIDGVATYDLLRRGNNTISVGHSFLSAQVFEESQFNQLDNAPFLWMAHQGMFRDWTPYQLGLRADYDYLEVGGAGFLQRYGVAPSLTLMHNDVVTSTWTTRLGMIDYLNREALENTILDADGNSFTSGWMLSRRFPSSNLTWQIAYNASLNDSEGGQLDFFSHQFQTAVVWNSPKTDWVVNLVGSYDLRDYDQPDFRSGLLRKDRELRLQGQLVIPLAPRWDFILGASLDHNDSTVETSVFQRETYEVGLRFHTTPSISP